MKLYNTLTKSVEPFAPLSEETVGIYVCGPTVYDYVHIGNVRPLIVFDTLRRYVRLFKGWRVIYVQNVTDVDDKLIQRSLETGAPVEAIARKYTDAYFRLLDALGVDPPDHSPRATDHVSEMVTLIESMVESGHAYARDGDVFFRVSSVPGYGRLSGRRIDEQVAGARVIVSERKDDPLDFALWKRAKPGEPSWPSPWGLGRPGWHTECVVMSRRYLGEHLDIHAGGSDLIFPHHENELAQADVTDGGRFFRVWLHNGMLAFGGEKMSKSLGNFAYAHEVLERYGPETVRYFYLSRHYRKPLDYSEAGLEAAQAAVERVRTLLRDIDAELGRSSGSPFALASPLIAQLDAHRARYIEAMDEDLNTVGAIGVIQEVVADANRFKAEASGEDRRALHRAAALVRELGEPLGLFQDDGAARGGAEPELLELLVELRDRLRADRRFDLADRIRDRLAALGITLKDTPYGTIWTR